MLTADEIRQGRILVVDDTESHVILLRKILKGAGYLTVATTTNPVQVCTQALRAWRIPRIGSGSSCTNATRTRKGAIRGNREGRTVRDARACED